MSWFPFWPLLGLLAVAALLPLAATLLRPPATRGRREADLALYRAQMDELAREREAGRLDEAAHRAATLEVQRRLLAAPAEAGPRSGRGAWRLLWALVLAVPALALGLYWRSGVPDMPSAPFALRQEVASRDEEMLQLLRSRLAALDPASPQVQEGYRLLGNAERSRGALGPAAEAYSRALAARFDADLAGQLAQVLIEDDKLAEAQQVLASALPQAPRHVGLRFLTGLVEARAGRPANARNLWQALIADAPAEAPWRAMVERRMQELP
ncbi:c-type cytochrome biogenesis protein CcmI [Belnapia rosea]|uniref:Cytochrome c-type biogenesis protein CcmH n=1 Tax=Belnapia rosea TaxID=938405 RepID=A0A1G7AFG9_9PROT|nr:c-type cytochrome biogenesis protein CcmI [Belnapia rosea]SDB69803.1 cytochrome c-type biogenesis protein CcmH [Belnapia rosea]SDE13207.1 cytochrome c-type biogenesis protein CcmH [Belnapia rosea]